MTPTLDIGNLAVGIGTAAVALVTLYVAVSGSNATKRQKISEFRRYWVEDLRSHFSEFEGLCYTAASYNKIIDATLKSKDIEEHNKIDSLQADILIKIRECHAYINLMLTDDEDLHVDMRNTMNDMISVVIQDKNISLDTPKFERIANKILRAEWKRLKEEM